MSSAPFQLSQMVPLGCAAPRHWCPHLYQVSLQWHSSLLVFWRPRNCAFLDLERGPFLKWPSSVSSVSSESCLPHLVYWSWNDRFSLWNRISYQLKLLAFWSSVPCCHIAPLPNLTSMMLHGWSISLAHRCSSRRIWWDDTSWWPCPWHLSAGAHSMSCLHHCRTGTHSGCCLTSPPLAVHPYISEETRSWIYAMEYSWAASQDQL